MSFPLRILTPEGPIFDDQVDAVRVTAFQGALGVLEGHAPMITALRAGPAKVTTSRGEQWYGFGEGTLEVRSPGVILLVDYAEKAASYDEALRIGAGDSQNA